jgi:tRNA G18 (ribose-2'-O)-methylase SpoU
MKVIILENIRSAYNVGNVIRTADALGRNVRLVGYTPSPVDNPKVRKTSLGAEEHVGIQQFNFSTDAIQKAKEL